MKTKIFFVGLVLCFSSAVALKANTDEYQSPVGDDEEKVVNTYQAGYDEGFDDALANRGFSPKAVQKKEYYDGYHIGYFTGLDSQVKYVEGYKKGLEDGIAMKAKGGVVSLPKLPDEKSPKEKAFRMGYLKGFQDGLKSP